MDASDTRDHPVWSLYDEMRTARLNVKCIECELVHTRRLQFWVEMVIAISATSSIGGFWFLQNFYGGYIWKTVGALAVICTALKPVFTLADRLKQSQELLASYRILDHDLHCISIEVKQRRKFDQPLQKELFKALNRKGELVKKASDSSSSKSVQRVCQAEVNKEMPTDSFYIPE